MEEKWLTREWARTCYGGRHMKAPTVFVVPEELEFTHVEERAFNWFTGEAIIFCEGIKYIGKEACRGLPQLKKVVLPSTLECIGEGAFCDCRQLEELKLPKGLKVIESSAFANCGVRKVVIPGSVSLVERMAFLGCNKLSHLKIQNGVRRLGQNCFGKCGNLTHYHRWNLPRSLEKVVYRNGLYLGSVWKVAFEGSPCARTWKQKRTAKKLAKMAAMFADQVIRVV